MQTLAFDFKTYRIVSHAKVAPTLKLPTIKILADGSSVNVK